MPATTPVLFPSGEDANPLHKRLPAEVVTRKRRPEAKLVEEKVVDDIRVDLKAAVVLKPDARPKWLSKACKMAEENRASTTELYNIVTSRKFLAGLPSKIGRRLRDIVHENLGLFSDKQQRHLRSDDWPLNAKYGERAGDDGELDALVKEDMLDDGREESEKNKPKRQERVDHDEPFGDKWIAAPAARGQEERVLREAALAEERAKRKAHEREEQERWMVAEAEASRRKAQEQQEAKKRQLEDEVDNSMMLLEQLGQHMPHDAQPEPAKKIEHVEMGRRRGGLSRSRSIRVRSRSRRRRKSRSRSRAKRDSGGRRRRRSASASRPKVDFADALRRRMEEREANDTTRIPVVDPGHAARWATR
mmetsp:Transcript_8251/g.22692  ORF Transcript_8251/g.22692 Transcript_8251/m.22692 type:complete len:362 (-) Transcript_8251:191-1276(-)